MAYQSNRNEQRIVEALAQGNASWIRIRSAAVNQSIDSFIPAVFSGAAGAVSGWTIGAVITPGEPTASVALGSIMFWASYNGFYFLDRFLSSPRYSADYWDHDEDEEEPPDGLIRTARQNELKRLTGRMRTLLQKFAANYEEIGTVAIIPWYESKYLNRTQIEDLRDYVVNIGAANKDGRGVVTLTEWGNQQLEKWADNDFSDVVELVNTPLPSNSRHIPVQE